MEHKHVGGNHYSKFKIQPSEFCAVNEIPFIEGCIIKRAARWRDKDGLQDLLKIKEEVDMLIEYNKLTPPNVLIGESDTFELVEGMELQEGFNTPEGPTPNERRDREQRRQEDVQLLVKMATELEEEKAHRQRLRSENAHLRTRVEHAEEKLRIARRYFQDFDQVVSSVQALRPGELDG